MFTLEHFKRICPQVKFLYDTDVVNLEAWKGDVSSLNQREYTVSSK